MSVKQYKALGNTLRMDILTYLIENKTSPCLDIRAHFSKVSQPTMSHHLSKLVDAKLISVKKVKTENFYSINPTGFLEILSEMKGLIDEIK